MTCKAIDHLLVQEGWSHWRVSSRVEETLPHHHHHQRNPRLLHCHSQSHHQATTSKVSIKCHIFCPTIASWHWKFYGYALVRLAFLPSFAVPDEIATWELSMWLKICLWWPNCSLSVVNNRHSILYKHCGWFSWLLVKFPLQTHQKYYITQDEGLGFS